MRGFDNEFWGVEDRVCTGDIVEFVHKECGFYYTLVGEVIDLGVPLIVKTINTETDYYKGTFQVFPEEPLAYIHTVSFTGSPEQLIDLFVLQGGPYEQSLRLVFSQGPHDYCFSDWLSHRLYRSRIVYLVDDFQYAVFWDNRLYNVKGEITHYTGEQRIHRFCGDWVKDR